MNQAKGEKLGEKRSLYCPDCEEEQIFVWTSWSGETFYGYPPEVEYGWVCAICGSRIQIE